MKIEQVDEGHEGLFIASENDENMGYMTYVWEGDDCFAILETIVKPKFEGQGVAKALLNYVVDFARTNNKKIHAVCPYVVALFARSKAFDDVKAF
ncbi:MAG: GNAT family N-acetyltransferase [Prevotella sp.]